MANRRKQGAGWSLVEVLTVLCLVAMAAALGVPPLRDGLRRTQIAAFSDTFFAHLMMARSEALKRGRRVVVCVKAGDRCAGSGRWSQGWLVFVDHNGDGQRGFDEPQLAWADVLPVDYLAWGNQNVARYVAYDAQGHTRMVSGAFQAGTVTFCRRSSAPGAGRRLVISSNGRPRVIWAEIEACA